MSGVMTSALSLIGEPVRNRRGERLGRLDDVFVDPVAGRLEFAVLTSGGFGRAERELRVVPWEALRIEEKVPEEGGESELVLETESEGLFASPVFSRGERPDFSDPAFLEHLRRQFGLGI